MDQILERNSDDPIVSQLLLQNPCRRAELDLSWSIERIIRYIERGLQDVEELRKCENEAYLCRSEGNRFYRERDFLKAIYCYNQCICRAPPDSEQLGMAYANRSAVSFEQREYEIALFNIDMAKKHNYPERLMPKLLERERNSRQRITDGHSKATVPCPRMNVNVDVNPKIPFLGKGIAMNYDPKFGRGLVALKDFGPGDIIMDEPLELCGYDFNLCYRICSHCSSSSCRILIPCPTCVLFMYCSVECRDLNWKLHHRFECGVASKLCCASGSGDLITARLFFYGLTQFGDDLQAMIEYCEKQASAESKPLDLDYTNLNRKELFNTLRNSKSDYPDNNIPGTKRSVASHFVVFLMNPVVKSIIRTEHQRQFFLKCLVTFGRALNALSTTSFYNGYMKAVVRPIGSLFNHSCDPHAIQCSSFGRIKVVLIRPVRKGEQIFTSYGLTWWDPAIRGTLPFKCQCVVCDQGKAGREWQMLKAQPFPSNAVNDMRIFTEMFAKDDVHIVARMNAIKQFIKRYAHCHPNGGFLGGVLKNFAFFVNINCEQENVVLERARLQARYL